MSFLAYIFPLQSRWIERQSLPGKDDKNISLDALNSAVQEVCKRVIITGPDTAIKTSLVFQAAVSAATIGSKVVHICTHPITKLPTPVHGMPGPEAAVMKNVDFLYFTETDELVSYFATVHMKKKLPNYIIVEDILSYALQNQEKPVERTLAKLLALIHDAQSWISAHNEGKQCSILLTAPSRIKAMQKVCRQFDYELSTYENPSKDCAFSQVSFTSRNTHLSVSFQANKDCLILIDVTLKLCNVSNSNDCGYEKG